MRRLRRIRRVCPARGVARLGRRAATKRLSAAPDADRDGRQSEPAQRKGIRSSVAAATPSKQRHDKHDGEIGTAYGAAPRRPGGPEAGEQHEVVEARRDEGGVLASTMLRMSSIMSVDCAEESQLLPSTQRARSSRRASQHAKDVIARPDGDGADCNRPVAEEFDRRAHHVARAPTSSLV